MKKMKVVLFIFIIIQLPVSAFSDITVNGYYKNFFTAIDPAKIEIYQGITENPPVEGIVQNRFRLKLFGYLSDNLSFTAAYEMTPTVWSDASNQSTSETDNFPTSLSYRVADLFPTIYPQSGNPDSTFYVGQNLDRFLFTLSLPVMDVLIGRQPIAFGSAHVINPTDVIAPFTYQDLDKEERVGVDAVVFQIPFGEMNEISAGAVFGDKFKEKNNAFFLRSKFYVMKTDFSLLTMTFKENFLVGLSLMRSIGGAGFWFETAYTFDSALNKTQNVNYNNYLRLSTGFDYNILDGLYASIEYHYNGAGETTPKRYFDVLSSVAYTEGGVYLLGQQYLSPVITYQISPLLLASLSAIYNINDSSAFLTPTIEYNFTENVYIQAGAYLALGEYAKVNFPSNDITPRSEFGLYSSFYFLSLRLYF